MSTLRPVYITCDALTTGVVVARVGGLARLARWYRGKRYSKEDWHGEIEGAFARVRAMVAEKRESTTGPGTYTLLNAIEATLDRGELPWAAESEEVEA